MSLLDDLFGFDDEVTKINCGSRGSRGSDSSNKGLTLPHQAKTGAEGCGSPALLSPVNNRAAPREATLKELADKVLARNKKQMQAAHPALRTRINRACSGLPITPDQFISIINDDDRQAIIAGEFNHQCLAAYARAFSEGIQSGRILFHPSTGALVRHGIK